MATIKEQYEAAKKAAQDYIDDVRAKDERGEGITDAQLKEARRLTDITTDLAGKVERNGQLKSLTDGLTGNSRAIADGWLPSGAKLPTSVASAQWAKDAADVIKKRDSALGTKASIVGTRLDVPALTVTPVPLLEQATSILQIIPTDAAPAGDGINGTGAGFSYPVQTLREHNVEAVADGGQKPTSRYGWDARDDRYRVYAHLSESIPERYLDDYSQLIALLQQEMANGLLQEVEEDVLAGPAKTENSERFTGILNTSGIGAVVPGAGDDQLTTLSNAYYTLTDLGETPNAWVMNQRDVQKLLLLRENGTTGPLLFGTGRTALEQFTGGARIIESSRMPAGTALLGNFEQCQLFVRQGATLKADATGEAFEHNTVKFRVEGRYGFAVKRPASFVKVTLPTS